MYIYMQHCTLTFVFNFLMQTILQTIQIIPASNPSSSAASLSFLPLSLLQALLLQFQAESASLTGSSDSAGCKRNEGLLPP